MLHVEYIKIMQGKPKRRYTMQDARIVHIKNTSGNSKTKQASCHAKKKKTSLENQIWKSMRRFGVTEWKLWSDARR